MPRYISEEDTDISIIVIDKQKCFCRGGLCEFWNAPITKGIVALRITTSSCKGTTTAYYCDKCKERLLDMMRACLEAVK